MYALQTENSQRRGTRQQQKQIYPSVDKLLLERELSSSVRRHQGHIAKNCFDRQVECLRPRTFHKAQGHIDKAFCSAWLDDAHVLVGTKCNTLLCLHAPSRTQTVISYPQQPVHRQGPDLFTGPRHTCGQHAIAVSPDGCFVATGGQHTQDIVLWQVQSGCNSDKQPSTTIRPLQTLMGHVDWVFGLAWVSNKQFVSAGRDRTIKLWQVPHTAATGSSCFYQHDDPGPAVLSVKFHKDKVRDIKYDQQQQQVAAVCVDSTISWWSSELLLRGSCLLPEQYEEPVVVQPHGSLLIVGCEQQALLIDTRAGQRLVAAVAASTGNSSKRSRINSHAAAAAEHSEPAAIVSSTESGQQMVRKGLQAVLQHNQPGGQAFLQQAEQQHMSGYVAMAPHSNAVHGQAVGQEAPASLLGNVHQQPLQQWAHDLDSQNDSASEEDFDSDEVEDVVITGVGGNEQLRPIQQYLQEQLQQPHHPPDPHHAYEWAWQTTAQHYSMQRRVLTSGHQQQGLKRLLHHDLEAAASPDGIKTDHAWVDAAVTGDIAVGRGRVRSLSLQHHLLGVGTGEGDLMFHDLRRLSDQRHTRTAFTCSADRQGAPTALGSAIVESPCSGFAASSADSEVCGDPAAGWREHSNGGLPARVHRLKLPDAPGTRADDTLLQAGLLSPEGWNVRSAVYTHCWDPTAMKLFAGGGPLHMGYQGCSLALYTA